MRELPLLTPQWLQSDPWGRGSNSPLPDYNHGSPHSTTGKDRNPKTWEQSYQGGHARDWGCGYSYRSNNSAERVHLYPTRDGARSVANRPNPPYHANSQSLRSHPASGALSDPFCEGNCTGTVKCSRVATWELHWEKVDSLPRSHLSPTNTPLSCWQVWFHTCRAQLGANPTLGEVVCTKGPMKQSVHSLSDKGELMSSMRK
jgi:hypothetical protein